MRSNLRLLLIAATVGLVASPGWVVRGQQTPAPKVTREHTVAATQSDDDLALLKRLGSEGWELVAVRPEEKFTGNFRQVSVIYYFKRARPSAP